MSFLLDVIGVFFCQTSCCRLTSKAQWLDSWYFMMTRLAYVKHKIKLSYNYADIYGIRWRLFLATILPTVYHINKGHSFFQFEYYFSISVLRFSRWKLFVPFLPELFPIYMYSGRHSLGLLLFPWIHPTSYYTTSHSSRDVDIQIKARKSDARSDTEASFAETICSLQKC